ncbi:hypothetical protein HaLaN_14070 [Haematococcus lacustris]|uniref:Reverse transcriptase domain-containing protein n=1 Tax=Haematococcus lacustris TaxID=44745 RepID=A0A699ZNJ1_HAELA|nr:hypothetical protein HaLaN_14070 [Haematococcus lacustris]
MPSTASFSLPSLTSNRPMTTYLDNIWGSTCGLRSSCHSPCLPTWRVCIGMVDGPHRTPPVTPDQGVKQGCPISPLLAFLGQDVPLSNLVQTRMLSFLSCPSSFTGSELQGDQGRCGVRQELSGQLECSIPVGRQRADGG